MNYWISVKDKLPPDNTIVKVKVFLLWRAQWKALFLHKYFIRKGENITKWVTHWKSLAE